MDLMDFCNGVMLQSKRIQRLGFKPGVVVLGRGWEHRLLQDARYKHPILLTREGGGRRAFVYGIRAIFSDDVSEYYVEVFACAP